MYISNEKEMQDFAHEFLVQKCSKKISEHSVVIALHGELGAGKSTFVRNIANELGIAENVTSPTFNIMKIYNRIANKNDFCSLVTKLVHIDAYRLKDAYELEKLNWQELLESKGNIIFVEWPKNVESAIPKSAMHLYFKYIDENTREIKEYPPTED